MKIYTDQDKWGDPWFRRLAPKLKLLWMYACDRCHKSGVIEIDWEDASFRIGEPVSEADLKYFEGRIVPHPRAPGKFFIPKFVPFQWKRDLLVSSSSPPVKSLIERIRRDDVWPELSHCFRNAPVESSAPKINGSAVAAFEKFWTAYPKKLARNEAERAFVETEGERKLQDILAALSWQVKSEDWTKERGRYVPSPANYLRDGRWQDQPGNNGGGTAPAAKPHTLWEINQFIEALQVKIRDHPANPESLSCPYTMQNKPPPEVIADLSALRKKLRELQDQKANLALQSS